MNTLTKGAERPPARPSDCPMARLPDCPMASSTFQFVTGVYLVFFNRLQDGFAEYWRRICHYFLASGNAVQGNDDLTVRPKEGYYAQVNVVSRVLSALLHVRVAETCGQRVYTNGHSGSQHDNVVLRFRITLCNIHIYVETTTNVMRQFDSLLTKLFSIYVFNSYHCIALYGRIKTFFFFFFIQY